MKIAVFLLMAACLLTPSLLPMRASASSVRGDTPPSFNAALFRQLKAFLGNARGSYILPNQSVYADFGEATSSGAEFKSKIDADNTILFGCRLHFCPERGAILLSGGRKIQAVGILHFACYNPKTFKPGACLDQARISIFLPRSAHAAMYIRQMRQWAKAEVVDKVAYPGAGEPSYEVVWLPRR